MGPLITRGSIRFLYDQCDPQCAQEYSKRISLCASWITALLTPETPLNGPFAEADRRLFRRYNNSMLEDLTRYINRQSMAIIWDASQTEHERFLNLYRHDHDSNDLVADCFHDWRRSRMGMHGAALLQHSLIPQAMWDELSVSARGALEGLAALVSPGSDYRRG